MISHFVHFLCKKHNLPHCTLIAWFRRKKVAAINNHAVGATQDFEILWSDIKIYMNVMRSK